VRFFSKARNLYFSRAFQTLESDGKRGRGTENKVLVVIAVELAAKEVGKKGRRKMGRTRIEVVNDASKNRSKGLSKTTLRKAARFLRTGGRVMPHLKAKGIPISFRKNMK